MIYPGFDEKLYSAAKLATMVSSLQAEGVAPAQALEFVDLPESDLSAPATRVSLNQLIQCCRNAMGLSADPYFAFHTGLRFHVSTYGMYGFAILSSTDFRRTMRFAVAYHQLATPTANLSFGEANNCGIWTIVPVPHPDVDATMYRFLVELQFGTLTTLFRNIMGQSFGPRELHVTYSAPSNDQPISDIFGCPMVFGQAENEFVFDAKWLDTEPEFGHEVSYASLIDLCDELMAELEVCAGLTGKVRQILLPNLARPTCFNAVARHLKITTRTLRRKLQEEKTSFRGIVDELRMEMAIKYLRETDLTVDDIAVSLGFSEATNFRHAFRRWTRSVPSEFRPVHKPSRTIRTPRRLLSPLVTNITSNQA